MNFFILIILCLIQGLTEFLPISSSGHLFVLEKIFGINDNILLINLFLHLATLFAVIIVYRKIIFKLMKNPFQSLTIKLIISTIITIIIAGVYKKFELNLYLDGFVGFYFIITAIILFCTYFFRKKTAILKISEISYRSAIFTGIFQGIAVLPGISRSGTTISCLTLFGNEEKESAEYSFLLSVPIIIGGFILELLKVNNWNSIFNQVEIWQIIFAFIFTLIVAIISIKLTIKLLIKNKFIYFAIYLIILGVCVIAFL